MSETLSGCKIPAFVINNVHSCITLHTSTVGLALHMAELGVSHFVLSFVTTGIGTKKLLGKCALLLLT